MMQFLKRHFKTLLYGSLLIVLGAITANVVNFVDSNTFKFQTPFVLQEFVIASPKQNTTINIVQASTNQNVSPLTADQQYACNKFGKDCDTAIAIMRAESHYRHDAMNINTNGTVDFGCFQINSLWLKDINTTNVNLFNCQQNTDIAYMIYTRNGDSFKDWVTYTTGAYKAYLINQ